MNIKHAPIFNTQKVIKHYSEKDGVDIKYVCTSALGDEAIAMDIFYRETPHPEFGNRYFGLYQNPFTKQVMITNADNIEKQHFSMIQDKKGDFHYSAHRHDYKLVDGKMIDGGRSYLRTNTSELHHFYIKDGEFVLKPSVESLLNDIGDYT
jgi:hypothetical protein